MKKSLVVFLLIIALAVGVIAILPAKGEAPSSYLRIHIRANSNEAQDQQVKYEVRDAIVNYLTPLLAHSENYKEAKKTVQKNLKNLENLTEEVLAKQGFNYSAKVAIKREEFPTRQYSSFTLEKGIYDAIIIELGKGEGNNWWCVAFPPLCFIPQGNSPNTVYKWKILEIINKYKEGNND